MNKFVVIEKIGKDLSRETIDFMVNKRIQEYGENTKDFDNNEQESLFFFLMEGSDIKAFGMLKPVIIYYKEVGYPIMGMGNVMAMEKGKGYGTTLMNHVKNYLTKTKQVCIGNTHKDNFAFYTKCGYTFIPGFVNRFVYYMKAKTPTVKSGMKRSRLAEGETVRNKYPDRKVGDIYIDTQGKETRGDWHDYAMFVYDKENRLKELINGNGDIVTKVPLW